MLTTLSAVAMGIALSACCGFRVFVPMLATALGARLGWIDLAPGMDWMGTLPALICFGSAALLEVLAYYVPFVDNLLDTISAPMAIAAGTVAAAAIMPVDENMVRWIAALVAGGGAAGTIHAGMGLLRLLSSKTTAGAGNAVVATTENAAAIGGVSLAIGVPLLAAALAIALVAWLASRLLRRRAN